MTILLIMLWGTVMFGYLAYQLHKLYKETNGLFTLTVFQTYLKKKGLSKEEIEEEIDSYYRCYNKLQHDLKGFYFSDNKARRNLAKYRKEEGFD